MDRTSVIAIIICSIVIFFAWPEMEPEKENDSEKSTTEEVADKKESEAPIAKPEVPEADVAEKVTDEKVSKKISEVKANPITLTTEFFSVTIDPEKGGIVKTALIEEDGEQALRFVNNKEDKQAIEIGSSEYPGLSFTLLDSDSKLLLNAPPVVTDSSVTITSRLSEEPTTLITQKWKLLEDKNNKYKIDYSVSVQNKGTKDLKVKDIAISCGVAEPLLPKESGRMYDGETTQTVGYYSKEEKGVETENLSDIKDMKKGELEIEDELSWISTQNRYFCSIVTPENDFAGIILSEHNISSQKPKKNDDGEEEKMAKYVNAKGLIDNFSIPKNESKTFKFQAYIGPKEYESLKALDNSNEDLLDLGWGFIGTIGKGVMYALNFIHNSLGLSYALAIIIITIFIKLLFWPITHKSTVSMKKMAKLQPLVKEIKEKYGDDPQLMQKKTMELYREKKVSPLGGCLPMLIQIPVFFALYSTFGSAIELRHQTFIWVGDLGMPDTVANLFGLVDINPLAIIMVVSMLLQQHFTPSTGDPNQKKMMMFMPFIMLFFMYSMPAGLTLYWTVNQLMSMLQFYFTNKSVAKEEEAEAIAN